MSDGGDVGPMDGGADVTLPFFIEEHYVMSGFFSESGASEVDRLECSGAQDTKAGATCIGVTFKPNGDTYGGFFFQYPADNWGAEPGLAIPPGAKQVRFRAWGAQGGESVKFGVGLNNTAEYSDGFNVEQSFTLTDSPVEYFIDLRNASYESVVGGFLWVAETPTGTGDVTFFMDNIEWTAEEPVVSGVSVPFWVDDHFVMSGFFPGPPSVVDIEESCGSFTGTDPASMCRRITFTPNGGTFGGFFFQSPADNWGAEPGTLIAQGATEVTFRAWGETGAEMVGFGAGIDNDLPNDDGWHVEDSPVALPTAPTEFSIDISGVQYDEVVGGFLWVASTPDGSTPITFYLDNVRWQ